MVATSGSQVSDDSLYRHLCGPRSIRLLRIIPGNADTGVKCELFETDLDSIPVFEALSYVWGNPADQTLVDCDGQIISVTVNLGDALRRLRLTSRIRVVWADAICINQDDLDERSRQVSIMRDIYSEAVRVIVWLGRDDGQSAESAVVLMVAITQTCDTNAQNRGRRWGDLTSQQMVQCADIQHLGAFGDPSVASSHEYWRALAVFFARPWFERVWCVQEIVMAKEALLMLGDVEVPWRVVGITASWLDSQQITKAFNVPALLGNIDPLAALLMYDGPNPELSLYRTLPDALGAHRSFKATDPLDKVYAVMGLVKHDPMVGLIAIDYKQPAVDVYTNVVLAALETEKSLRILSYVQHADLVDTNTTIPSWVPRWDVTLSQSTRFTLSNDDDVEWSASVARELKVFSKTSPKILRLQGIILDTVSFASKIMDQSHFDFGESESSAHPVLELWKQIPCLRSDVGELLKFARTLTGEMDVDHNRIMYLDDDLRQEFYADFLKYMIHLHELDQKGDDSTSPVDWPHEGGDWKRYEICAQTYCDQRRFFRTSGGRMGLGPAAMQEDDIVVILYGGRTPFVLRQSGQQYYFLGEGFVEDLMRGGF